MTGWRDEAACQGLYELFFTRGLRSEALHICRFHCPVAMSCHAEMRRLVNIEVVVGARAYGSKGDVLTKTEAELGVLPHNRFCRSLEFARQRKEA